MAHVSDGDELIGLNRALLFAGTPTVVGSLWRVDDESTAFLMERFHIHLREGTGKAEALRQAQIDARNRYPHPYYWAGFVLTGDPARTTIVSQEARPKTEISPTVPTPIGDDGGRIPWWAYASGVSFIILGVVIWTCFRKHK